MLFSDMRSKTIINFINFSKKYLTYLKINFLIAKFVPVMVLGHINIAFCPFASDFPSKVTLMYVIVGSF